MNLTVDARRAVPGLVALMFGRRDAVSKFNLSVSAFWRVFCLALSVVLVVDVGFRALISRNGAQIFYDGTMLVLSIVGGTAAAVQVLMVMGALENWENRILRFLIPLAWIGISLWTAVTVWQVASFGLALEGDINTAVCTAMSLLALYAAWQAARLGLGLSMGGACAVLLVYGCAEFAGFALVNLSLFLLPH
jgi:hypothetical protein